jgi:hypothetical protein
LEPDGTSEICSIQKGEKCLRTYLVPSTGNIRFEVKDHDETLYTGESFEQARNLYEQVCRH